MAHSVRRELEWLERRIRNKAKALGVPMEREAILIPELEKLVREVRKARASAHKARDRIAVSRLASVEIDAQKTIALLSDLAAKRAAKAAPKEDGGEHARTMARVLAALDRHPEALEAVRAALEAAEH